MSAPPCGLSDLYDGEVRVSELGDARRRAYAAGYVDGRREALEDACAAVQGLDHVDAVDAIKLLETSVPIEQGDE